MAVTFHVIGIEADLCQQPCHALAALGLVADAVNHQRFCNDVADLHARIQRRIWILKDDLHLVSQFAQLALAHCGNVASLKFNVTTRWFDEPQQAAAGSRFTTSGLAHQTESLAARDIERHAVDGAPNVVATLDGKVFDDVADADERIVV